MMVSATNPNYYRLIKEVEKVALKQLLTVALTVSDLNTLTGRSDPTVVT